MAARGGAGRDRGADARRRRPDARALADAAERRRRRCAPYARSVRFCRRSRADVRCRSARSPSATDGGALLHGMIADVKGSRVVRGDDRARRRRAGAERRPPGERAARRRGFRDSRGAATGGAFAGAAARVNYHSVGVRYLYGTGIRRPRSRGHDLAESRRPYLVKYLVPGTAVGIVSRSDLFGDRSCTESDPHGIEFVPYGAVLVSSECPPSPTIVLAGCAAPRRCAARAGDGARAVAARAAAVRALGERRSRAGRRRCPACRRRRWTSCVRDANAAAEAGRRRRAAVRHSRARRTRRARARGTTHGPGAARGARAQARVARSSS